MINPGKAIFGISAAAAIIAVIAAPPKLRAATKMGYLLMRTGIPYIAIHSLVRLSTLSCNHTHSNYLSDPAEVDANLAAFASMDPSQQDNIVAWYELLEAGGNINIPEMVSLTMGLTVDNLSDTTLEDFKSDMGASYRSLLLSNGLDRETEVRPVFNYMDKDGMCTSLAFT